MLGIESLSIWDLVLYAIVLCLAWGLDKVNKKLKGIKKWIIFVRYLGINGDVIWLVVLIVQDVVMFMI